MSNIYLHKDKFTLETDKWIEQQLFIVRNHVVFDNGERDIIEISVLASGKYEAWALAKDFLLSRKAFNIKAVEGQSAGETKSFLIQKINNGKKGTDK